MTQQFGRDQLWSQVKMLLREQGTPNDWFQAISVYNLAGGKQVELFFITDEKIRYRVLSITDTPDRLLVIDSSGQVMPYSINDAREFKKIFINDLKHETKRTYVSPTETYQGSSEFTYYI